MLRRRARRGNCLPKRDGARSAAIRCRESFVLSSREQVAAFVVERQQPPFGCRMRFDCTVMQDVADGKSALGEAARQQETAVAVERLALRAHQADA